MRKLLLGTAFGLWASVGLAEDVALVLGTERYDDLGRLSRGDEPAAATERLEEMGFDVLTLTDARAAAVGRALDGFVARAPRAERIVVALSGRFVTDGDRTWYLTADAEVPALLTLDETAVSVDSIMQVMTRAPGAAILLLAHDAAQDAQFDPWLAEGLGDLDIPQGVTVLYGEPRAVARFMRDELVAPEGDLARLVAANRAIRADGFLPRELVFMGPAPRRGIVIAPDGQQDPVRTGAGPAEIALWSGALALNTEEAFNNYIRRFPRGEFAEEARARAAAIRAEPGRAARLGEEALQLSRNARRQVQRNLTLLEYNTRGVDGIFGSGTRNAITNWQQVNGFAQTGYLTEEQVNRMQAQAQRREQQIAEEAAQADRARRQAENDYWQETGATGTIAGLRAYISRYPDGRYADVAQQRIEAAQDAEAQEARAQERAVWDNMRAVGDIGAFENYLRIYPNGEFQRQASDRLAELRAARDRDDAPSGGIAGVFEQGERALGLDRLTRQLVEIHLQSLGMDPGAAEGDFDDRTRIAIRRFQNERGLPVTGYLDVQTAAMMLSEAR